MTKTAWGVEVPDYAGLRQYRRAKSTSTHVGVYDGIAAEMDTSSGRWQTVCEDHGSICSHSTLALARAAAVDPQEWCEPCQGIVDHWLRQRGIDPASYTMRAAAVIFR